MTDRASSPDVIAVDLGKTRCRVRITDAAGGTTVLDSVGSPGLAAAHGVDAAFAAIMTALADAAHLDAVIGVGAAGALHAPDEASQLAARLHAATGARVAVASDVVTAHLGAFDGSAGVLLIAGTGAVALGIQSDGHRIVDGWGPELGDLGSGSWIGRAALRAALRAGAGIGPASGLTTELSSLDGGPVRWLAEASHAARRLASLAPTVIAHAERGDAVGEDVIAEAVRLLAVTAHAAGDIDDAVVLHGGLAESEHFRIRLHDALRTVGRTSSPPRGDALDGAAQLATGFAPLHERFVHRAG